MIINKKDLMRAIGMEQIESLPQHIIKQSPHSSVRSSVLIDENSVEIEIFSEDLGENIIQISGFRDDDMKDEFTVTATDARDHASSRNDVLSVANAFITITKDFVEIG